jgi:methyl-accepting chemotaxis protein
MSSTIGEVAAATRQQEQGVSQIAVAIEQINIVTQTVAANAEESSSASVELRERAGQLTEAVSAFSTADDARTAQRPRLRRAG